LVYDLIAKIWPESDSVYDLTAIDSSRQFRDFEDYLLSKDRFAAMRSANELRVAIDTESKSYFAERLDRLRDALTRVDALAAMGNCQMRKSIRED
jgi:hypothetical protein